jgi:ribosomal protein S18 acetylase RimI-like enzyme
MWLGEKVLPEEDYNKDFNRNEFGITFGIRIYGEARGKGLSTNFMNEAINRFKDSQVYGEISKKGLWLETKADNLSAIKLYSKFGFKVVSKANNFGEIVMVQSEIL